MNRFRRARPYHAPRRVAPMSETELRISRKDSVISTTSPMLAPRPMERPDATGAVSIIFMDSGSCNVVRDGRMVATGLTLGDAWTMVNNSGTKIDGQSAAPALDCTDCVSFQLKPQSYQQGHTMPRRNPDQHAIQVRFSKAEFETIEDQRRQHPLRIPSLGAEVRELVNEGLKKRKNQKELATA